MQVYLRAPAPGKNPRFVLGTEMSSSTLHGAAGDGCNFINLLTSLSPVSRLESGARCRAAGGERRASGVGRLYRNCDESSLFMSPVRNAGENSVG